MDKLGVDLDAGGVARILQKMPNVLVCALYSCLTHSAPVSPASRVVVSCSVCRAVRDAHPFPLPPPPSVSGF